MNKKLIRNIVIAVVALTILLGLYFVVDKWQPTEEPENVSETAQEIIAYDGEADDIVKVDIKSPERELTINIKNNKYTISQYPSARLLDTRLAILLRELDKVSASRVIEGVTDYEQYGLGSSSEQVKITYKNKTENVLYVGAVDPTDTYYYLMNDKDDKVYIVNKYNITSLKCSVDEFRDKNYGDFDLSSLKRFELYNGNDKIVSIRELRDKEDLPELLLDNIVMTEPYYEYASLEKIKKLFEGHTSIDAVSIISDTGASKSPYSIGKYTIIIEDKDKEHKIRIGERDADGNVYASYDGIDNVFLLNSYWEKVVTDFVPFEYLYKLIHTYKIDDVAELKYTSPQGYYLLNINRDNKEPRYLINGSEYDERTFRNAFAEILQITFTSSSDEAVKGDKVGAVKFVFTNGEMEEINYYNADERNYLVERGDGSKYLVLKKNFDVVYNNITAFLENK